ncbi:TPA: aspartate--tRNA(Asn) ligase [Candidatus Wolfebacteria bacterium]|nr:aspartate--tRNA(Asn) ligase [Candidatus Wolfebacteria bacterium]
MERIHSTAIGGRVGQTVKLAGWAQAIRDQGGIMFIVLRDITGTAQLVISGELLEAARSIQLESVIEVVGQVATETKSHSGVGIQVSELTILSMAEPELPIPVVEKSDAPTDQQIRLDWRFLDIRKPEKALLFKVWTELERSFIEYCTEQEYIEIHSPKLMSTPSEGGAELFEVQYFERKAYLAQSPQFYKQMAMAGGFEKVFEIGPVFRAEPSSTPRHATEFNGFDLEKSFITSHQDIIQEEERLIVHALTNIKTKYGEEIKRLYQRDVHIPVIPFPQLTVAQAKEILGKLGITSEKEGDLSPEEEREISKYIKETHGHEFVFITEYPASVRAFYHMRLEDKPDITKSFDLLWNGIEITTGAQREHRLEILIRQAKEKGIGTESLQFYFDFFKYGCPPHGGFGAGPERMIMKLFGLDSIREASYIYRGMKRLTP